MKTKALASFAFGCLVALAVSARAQVQTFETLTSYSGSLTSFGVTPGRALTQTFANVTLVQSMTYRFASTSSVFAGTSLNAYFTEWNPTTNLAVGSALFSGTISVPDSTSFTSYTSPGGNYNGFDYQFTLNAATDPTKTYAMVLVGTASTNIGLLNIDGADAFAFGNNLSRTGISTSSVGAGFTSLSTSGNPTGTPGFDWGFSQIAVTPYVAPIPEPHTAAAMIAGVFVVGLVGRRMWQRRQPVAQPAAVIAAA